VNEQGDRKVSHYLYLRDAAAPVYEGETDDEALARAGREIPAFRERLARVDERRRSRARGIPAEELDRYLADRAQREFSGNLRVRLPRHLHRELVEQAELDGVSLNTLIVGLLERGVGSVKGLHADSPAIP
jgi:hypothetical protein